MEKLIFINACIRREDSRTLLIAKELLGALQNRYDITEIDLTDISLLPTTYELYRLKSKGKTIDFRAKEYAKLLANADRIVIAAPLWDMSFPSILKVFFEHTSTPDITFKNNPDGTTCGNCKAEKMLYITTRGMEIQTDSPLDQGTSYLRALNWLWGIEKLYTVAACGLDIVGNDVEQLIKKAINEGLEICEEF